MRYLEVANLLWERGADVNLRKERRGTGVFKADLTVLQAAEYTHRELAEERRTPNPYKARPSKELIEELGELVKRMRATAN